MSSDANSYSLYSLVHTLFLPVSIVYSLLTPGVVFLNEKLVLTFALSEDITPNDDIVNRFSELLPLTYLTVNVVVESWLMSRAILPLGEVRWGVPAQPVIRIAIDRMARMRFMID